MSRIQKNSYEQIKRQKIRKLHGQPIKERQVRVPDTPLTRQHKEGHGGTPSHMHLTTVSRGQCQLPRLLAGACTWQWTWRECTDVHGS